MNDNKFGLFLKELRNEKGLSQEELGEILFVHRTSINKWEKGNVIPLNDTLLRISDYFDVSVDELLNGKRNILEDKSSTNRVIIDLIHSNKKLNVFLFFTGILFVILLLLFLFYYFFTTFDSLHVYRVNGLNDYLLMRDGLMIVSNDKLYFRIGDFYYDNEKITLDEKEQIKIIYRDDKGDRILLQGDVRNLFVELSKSKELLIKIMNNKNELYLKVDYNGLEEELKLSYYEDFSNDSIVTSDVDTLCGSNLDVSSCEEKSRSRLSDSDSKINLLIKNGFKYDDNKELYYLNKGSYTFNYYYNNYLIVIERNNNKYIVYTIYFNDKSFRILSKNGDKEEIFVKNYCELDKLDKNYIDYKNFYNKILPHYFRDFLGCE